MSMKKRPLTEIPQGRTNGPTAATAMPGSRRYHTPQSATTTERRSAYRNGITHVSRPGSARNVLRQLARVTATTTAKRVATPTSTIRDKENVSPIDSDEDVKDDLIKPTSGFNIEESIEEEEDSDLPVAPTPSALLERSDDEDLEQPTVTFLDATHAQSAISRRHQIPLAESSLLYSDPTLPAIDGEGQHESTFLSERGRRAVSEDRTRMSRYSFGSIRMSDFGSELEIRRESDRQQKLAELEAEDDYGAEIVQGAQLGGETEILKGLQVPTPPAIEEIFEVGEVDEEVSFDIGLDQDEGSQLSNADIEESSFNAAQAKIVSQQPQLADTFLELNDESVADPTVEHRDEAAESRRQTLLESMISTAAEKKPKKKLKINQRGNMVPGLPSSLIKRIIHSSQEKANKRKTAFGKDHIKALEQATEWFFEQASQDLETYSSHGRRKKRIDTDDVLLLMRRQRVLKERRELQKMAKEWLPREILNELDLPDHV